MVGVDIREKVIHEIVGAMAPMLDTVRLNMLEGAIRGALRGLKLEEESTELSTELDGTDYMIQCFCANKKLEGCADGTLERYRDTAKKFFQTVNKGYSTATKDDIKAYLAIRSQRVAANTVISEKRNLSSFFTWLHEEGYINKNPIKGIKVRAEDVELIYFTTQEEIAIRDTCCNLRDKALIAFLLSTGVRVGELAALNRSDVDLESNSVTFRGEKSRKGKFRTVYLDEYARRYLRAYLVARTDFNPALFVSTKCYDGEPRRLTEASIEKITKAVTERAGVTKKGTVHIFRKTFATRMADRGCPLNVIQDLLGHADLGTTMKCYVAKIPERNREEWRRYVFAA
nr:MAG TPA: SITE SPECIFIC RECOMBINASE XERD [Caudoviricetes sp.]